jgi:outer membrane immunogenic protein
LGATLKKFVILFAAMTFSGSAFAGAPVAPSWTGFYIGGNLGAAWPTDSQFVMTDPATPLFAPGQTAMVQSDRGNAALMGGFQAGYNYQFSPTWVAGVEADWSFTGLHLAASAPMNFLGVYPSAGSNLSTSSDVPGIGSVRGRLGYAGIQNWLIYGTGGWAYADVRDAAGWVCGPPACNGNTFTANANANKFVSGWTAGGGVEYHLPAGNWIIGAEYLYYKLDATESAVAFQTPFPAPYPMTWGSFNVQEVRARLSYKF